jgi:cytochrome P450
LKPAFEDLVTSSIKGQALAVPIDEEEPLDPLCPPRPVKPFYDQSRNAWVLSRYTDVAAALREPELQLRTESDEDGPEVRSKTLAAFSAGKLAEWQAQLEPLADRVIDRLTCEKPIDIVQEFARPWCLATAVIVTGADPGDAERLAALARQVSTATADPRSSSLQAPAKEANMELQQVLQSNTIPNNGQAFIALSQTLPCFLANAWVALLRHDAELARLRSERSLMPRAIEELWRYAGLTREVSRYARSTVMVGNTPVAKDDRVILLLASANRDPEQFPNPDRLDWTRSGAGQVALGAGPHACAGASLLRMAASVATRVFVERVVESKMNGPIEWSGGRAFRWAASLYVVLAARTA